MQGLLLYQEEEVKSGILLRSDTGCCGYKRCCCFSSSGWGSPNTAAVFSFPLKLPSLEETCSHHFPFSSFFSPMKGNHFFSCFGWTVLDILEIGSDGTSNRAGYCLSFKEIAVFIMEHASWMPHRPLHPSGPRSYGE